MARAALIRLALAIAGVVLLILVVGFSVRSCDKRHSEAAQQKVNQAQTGAVLESGADASNTQANVAANDMATANLDAQNEKDIRHAKGADAIIDPAAQSAGLRALCKRKAYRDRPECRVQ